MHIMQMTSLISLPKRPNFFYRLVSKNYASWWMEDGRTFPSISMESNSTSVHPITQWLKTTNGFWFSLYTAFSAFCLYTCIFALRKTFGVATYENMGVGGVDFKVWMVIFQVIGYMLSKFIGIKVVSELGAHARLKGILLMVS